MGINVCSSGNSALISSVLPLTVEDMETLVYNNSRKLSFADLYSCSGYNLPCFSPTVSDNWQLDPRTSLHSGLILLERTYAVVGKMTVIMETQVVRLYDYSSMYMHMKL